MKKRIAMVAIWCAALVCCLCLADHLMRRDDSERKYGPFFEDKMGFDVLFFGTSRVLDGITPVELWRDHGMTSYNMGNNSEPLGMTKWVLDIASDVHMPKVAVFDVFYVDHAVDESWTYSFRHMFYDAVPLSRKKIEAVRATQGEDGMMEFLMPFSLYHSRWEELLAGTAERMVESEKYMMGCEMRVGSQLRDNYTFTDEIEQSELPGHQAIREIVALCREKGIEPVFVALPGHASNQEQMDMNSVAPLCEELGVPFINMVRMEGIIDYVEDCFDWHGHLDSEGAGKVTAYLGSWLKEHYDLPDHRGESGYAHWDENLALYEARLRELGL